MPTTSLGTWLAKARGLMDHIEATQLDKIETASRWCAEVIAGDGLVHLFGSGHSRIPVEEMFPRYGSYPGFNPLVELSMTFHTQVIGSNGQPQAMFIERTEGLAEVILQNHVFRPQDMMIVFSASGRSAVPLEIAKGARDRGLRVVAVTSIAESMAQEPTHSSGTRLLDHADLIIDLGTPPGDAMVELDGLETPVGPGSTLANIVVVNELKVRTAELLVAAEKAPSVITSPSVVGTEQSQRLFDDAYADHRRRVSRS